MEDKPYAAFATELDRLMARERMNQTELAAASGPSASYISKLLTGTVQPSFEMVLSLAKALRAELDELAFYAGYAIHHPKDRPSLPGWEALDKDDRAQVIGLVARFAEMREAAAVTPPARGRTQGELVTIYESLPEADREALLLTARDMRESAERQSRPASEEPTPLRRREGQEPA